MLYQLSYNGESGMTISFPEKKVKSERRNRNIFPALCFFSCPCIIGRIREKEEIAMKKIFAVFLAAFAVCALPAQTAAERKAQFTGSLDSFLQDINTNLPDNAVAGGTWSDGYIGQLIALPPHLGIGVSCGFSRFPLSGLVNAADQVGGTLNTADWLGNASIPLINPAVELRIGGFVLPFDAGIRFSILSANDFFGLDVKYKSFSIDLRYALIESNVILPDLVVGLGWYHTSGSIDYGFNSADLASEAGFSVPDTGTQNLGLDFRTNVFEARVQVSKTLLVFTPYLGLTGYYAKSESSYEIADEENTIADSCFGSRIYGGLSFNIFLFKIDLSANYNFVSGNWGGNLGARFQL